MNQSFNSYTEFWKQLGPNQKVSIVLSAFLVIAAAAALFVWAQRPNMSLLYGSVSGKDAAAIVEYLDQEGIEYDIRSGGSAIYVPRSEVYRARMNVASQGLVQGDSTGFEIFDRSAFGISDFIQRTNFIRAIQGELSRTITQLNGVKSARVMVVMPENRLLIVNDAMETTASVFVDLGASVLSAEAVRSIQSLVANAVLGLTQGNVAVVDNNGNVLSKDNKDGDIMQAGSGVVEYRQSLEKYFGDKVETMLEAVVGRGNVVVRVATEVDASQTSTLKEDFSDEGGVLREQTTREEISSSSTVDGGDAVADGEADANAVASSNSRTGDESVEREQRYEIDRTVTNKVEAPGQIKRISASVFVALKMQPGATAEDEAVPMPRTEAELTQLRQMVANALGIPESDPDFGTVAIQETVFNGQTAGFAQFASSAGFDWTVFMNHADEIFGGIVAVVILLVFLSLLKRARTERSLMDRMHEMRMDAQTQVDMMGQNALTPEILNELIRQKPENVSTNLRKWLSGSAVE